MPMTFDTYNNCAFGCLYCFSQFQRALGKKKDSYLHKDVKSVNPEAIKRMFTDPDRYAGQFATYIKQRRVMQWGGLSDEFDGYERKYGKTLEILRFFKEIDYPLCFSTKATWFTEDDRYMSLIEGQKNWNFKFSIITLDEKKAKIIERGVPTPLERLEAIRRIVQADAGGATLRLRPFIIGITTPTYLDLIREAAERGATAVSTEFFCMEQRSKTLKDNAPIFNQQCGFDLFEFYKKYSYSQGYLRLNRKVKRPFVENMKNLCDELGLRCGDNGVFRGVPMTKEQFLLKHIAKSTYANYPSDGKYVISKIGTNSAGGDCFDVVICQSKLPQAQETEFKEKVLDTLYRSYVSNLSDNPKAEFKTNINPLGEWEGGTNVDCGATNRKLGSDMGDAVTGGGLHGKDLSKADVSVNIVCHIKAQAARQCVEAYCAIGDGEVVFNYEDGKTEIMLFPDLVEQARQWLQAECGGSFERLAEWGLIR